MTSGATDLYAILLAVGCHVTVAKAGGENQIHSQICSENVNCLNHKSAKFMLPANDIRVYLTY